MIKINEVIVVEGKYDKIKLEQIFDTLIITTDGFYLFKNKQKISLLKRLAKEKGLIVLTDSDAAGFKIRNYIKSCLGDIPFKNAYIPEIFGKEKRKAKPGAEGILGVEGMTDEIISNIILNQASVNYDKKITEITKNDFFEMGLAGGAESAKKRQIIAKNLNLPTKISANALLDITNILYTKAQIWDILKGIKTK